MAGALFGQKIAFGNNLSKVGSFFLSGIVISIMISFLLSWILRDESDWDMDSIQTTKLAKGQIKGISIKTAGKAVTAGGGAGVAADSIKDIASDIVKSRAKDDDLKEPIE